MVASDPTIEATRGFVDESLDSMRAAIAGASPDALSRRPAGDDTNTIAVLVVHAVHSTRWWLSVALGTPLPERDRPSEFLTTVAGADELLAVFDPIAADCRALLDTDVAFDAGAIREDPREGEEVTAAWALIHAVEHLREHVAHAELTRQVFERPV
ncbi:MAG: mycothiol transferase [Actinomycetota bacterium]